MRKLLYFNRRSDERGAALVTTLLLSTLMLAAGTALVLTTSMQVTTAVLATGETQAYYGAEAGLQAALNVLRGNASPVAGASLPAGTKMSEYFRTAVTPNKSNRAGDPMTGLATPVCRLSGWLNYSYPNTLTISTNPATANRVPVQITGASYDPATDIAYSVQVIDPDNTPLGTEPTRMIITSTGYGPNGSIKQLQMMINWASFIIDPPATVTLRGADDGSPLTFDTGSSNAKDYSGADNHGGNPVGAIANKPSFATTGPDIARLSTGIKKPDTVYPQVTGNPLLGVLDISTGGIPTTGVSTSIVSTPTILQSATEARKAVADLKALAQEAGGSTYVSGNFSGTVGTTSAPAFKFVDGNANLDGGAGLLVVTGTLTMNGNPNFQGLIMVLGGGSVTRDGGGNGNIYGAMLIAKFGSTGGFQGPTFNTNGGGNSLMQYDSEAIRRALNLTGRPVLGVVER